jgi:hypothetical protein
LNDRSLLIGIYNPDPHGLGFAIPPSAIVIGHLLANNHHKGQLSKIQEQKSHLIKKPIIFMIGFFA